MFALILLGTAACTVGPEYKRPQLAVPVAWQAPRPHDGSTAQLAGWWRRLNDPVLVRLQELAEADSPTLDQALARIAQARATLSSSQADALPSVSGSASYSRAGQGIAGIGESSGSQAQSSSDGLQGSLDASWEIDLFGKIRRNNQAARARITARTDDWNDARISLAAEVADDYIQLRGCEQLADLYRQQAASQGETARLTRISANAGFTAPADAELAEASAASVRSSLTDQKAQCDLLVKSLVSLSGAAEADVRAMLAPGRATLPEPSAFEVESVPADLVRQRPDVASAERELAATSAEIGAAIADLYPSLSLSGTISAGSGLTSWSFGPSLSLPFFSAKARAGVRSARASYDLQLGTYRESVRSAILEVEQAFVRLESARSRQTDAQRAAQGYQANFVAIDKSRQVGSASMLDRESARRDALDAQRSLVSLRTTQVREWIALYKALGGGWSDSTETGQAPSSGVKQP